MSVYNPYGQPTFPTPYGPYGQPYQPYAPYQQPQAPAQPTPQAKPSFDFVNGVEGAKSYGVAPNRTAILMDTENAAVYIKSANGIGQCAIDFYSLTKSTEEAIRAQHQKADNPTFATKDELAAISGRLDAIEKSLAPKAKDGEEAAE